MNLPALIFGLLLASGIGLLFHLVRGGPLSRMLLYLLSAWIGFGAGHTVGSWLDLRFLRLGAINLLAALLGALLALVLTEVLAPPDRPQDAGPAPPAPPFPPQS